MVNPALLVLLPIGMAAIVYLFRRVSVVAGLMADIQGTYRLIFAIIAFAGVGGSVLLLLATSPKPPVRKEGIQGAR